MTSPEPSTGSTARVLRVSRGGGPLATARVVAAGVEPWVQRVGAHGGGHTRSHPAVRDEVHRAPGVATEHPQLGQHLHVLPAQGAPVGRGRQLLEQAARDRDVLGVPRLHRQHPRVVGDADRVGILGDPGPHRPGSPP
ncbi:MAG: hypothetical protein DI571_03090, partial [Arsenicicoccus sp.]